MMVRYGCPRALHFLGDFWPHGVERGVMKNTQGVGQLAEPKVTDQEIKSQQSVHS